MYSYLYSEKLSHSSVHRAVAAIETRLHDLDIAGNICRLTPTKNLREVIQQELHRGVKTIVAVGEDSFVERVVTVLATYRNNAILGIIPAASGTHDIAQSLSIPFGVDACNILSYRMVRTLRLGKVNNRFFLSSVECSGMLSVSCNGAFTVTATPPNKMLRVRVTNNPYEELRSATSVPPLKLWVNPTRSSRLSLTAKDPQESFFLSQSFSVNAEDRLSITIDDHGVTVSPPLLIESSSVTLKMITGALRPSVRATLSRPPTPNKHSSPEQYGW